MTVIDRSLLTSPTAASFERIAFGRVNVRASEPLGDRARSRFLYLVELFTERIVAGRLAGSVASDDPDNSWFVSLISPSELPNREPAASDDRFLLFTFRRASEDDGPIFVLDTQERWFAICPPEWTPLSDARTDTQTFLRAIITQWGQYSDQATEYDLDYVTSGDPLREWLRFHPTVTDLTIWISHTNPGRPRLTGAEMDRQREQMRELSADQVVLRYQATRGGGLNGVPDVVNALESNMRQSHVQMGLTGRRADGELDAVSSRDGLEQTTITQQHDSLGSLVQHVFDTFSAWVTNWTRDKLSQRT